MKFLVSEVPADDIGFCGDDGLFKMGDKRFYHEVELTDESLTICDSCGRFIPIEINDVHEFAELLLRISEFLQVQDSIKTAGMEATAINIGRLLQNAEINCGKE